MIRAELQDIQVAQSHLIAEPTNIFLSGSDLRFRASPQSSVIDLDTLYLPRTTARLECTTIYRVAGHRTTALWLAESCFDRSTSGAPEPRLVTRQLCALRNVLDWLSRRGIYQLSAVDSDTMDELILAYSTQGWIGALDIDDRWRKLLSTLTDEEIRSGVYFSSSKGQLVGDCLRRDYWAPKLALGKHIPLTAHAKQRIQEACGAMTSSWSRRAPDEVRPPSIQVLRNFLSWLGEWSRLPTQADALRPLARPTPRAFLSRSNRACRTQNLSLDLATTTISHAIFLLHRIGPLLVRILKDTNNGCRATTADLRRHPARKTIYRLTRRRIMHWTTRTRPKRESWISFDEALSAVQGACAVIIGAFNGRRQREICDPVRGLRTGDLDVFDKDLGVFQTKFYIEKTHHARHPFFINKTTAMAIELLEELKRLSFDSGSAQQPHQSIFACGRRASRGGGREFHFVMSSSSKMVRALRSFEGTFKEPAEARITPHMFRRFFALLYYHRYDNAELRSLKQHLRHLNISMTKIYVTDERTRPLSEQIRARIGRNALEPSNTKLPNFDDHFAAIDDSLGTVERERLESFVSLIVSGSPYGGLFGKTVLSLYRKMTRAAILVGEQDSRSAELASHLSSRGYRFIPYPHGVCHAPDLGRPVEGRCERSGVLHRERASITSCTACPFHSTDREFLKNVQEDLAELEQELASEDLSPLELQSLMEDVRNTRALIELLGTQLSETRNSSNV